MRKSLKEARRVSKGETLSEVSIGGGAPLDSQAEVIIGKIARATGMTVSWQDRFALRRLAQPCKRMVFLKRLNGRWLLTIDSTSSVCKLRFKSFGELKDRLAYM